MKKLLLIAVCFLVLLSFASAKDIIGFAPAQPDLLNGGWFAPVQPLMGAGVDGSEPVLMGEDGGSGFALVQPLMGAGADGSEPVKYMIIGGIIANPIEEDSGM